ncbi:flagellar hook-length control protein FliK [Polycladidibacter stylochi]|uniref:flagellar hook-length control protein FliK n=1 Tax=Polycladidibacter stylochi TaxID=1807766 RepID=UPI0008341268|nr:flagellar hook-length control protein FliK [Pseudovibrio stylochi]
MLEYLTSVNNKQANVPPKNNTNPSDNQSEEFGRIYKNVKSQDEKGSKNEPSQSYSKADENPKSSNQEKSITSDKNGKEADSTKKEFASSEGKEGKKETQSNSESGKEPSGKSVGAKDTSDIKSIAEVLASLKKLTKDVSQKDEKQSKDKTEDKVETEKSGEEKKESTATKEELATKSSDKQEAVTSAALKDNTEKQGVLVAGEGLSKTKKKQSSNKNEHQTVVASVVQAKKNGKGKSASNAQNTAQTDVKSAKTNTVNVEKVDQKADLHIDKLKATLQASTKELATTKADNLAEKPDVKVMKVETHFMPSLEAKTPSKQVAEALLRSTSRTTPAQSILNDINSTISEMKKTQPLRVLQVQLRPDNLGTVRVNMQLRGNELQVSLSTTTREAAEMLQRDKGTLHRVLQQVGYKAESSHITISFKEDNFDQFKQGADGRFAGGQGERGSSGGNSQSNQQEAGRNQNYNENKIEKSLANGDLAQDTNNLRDGVYL